MSPSLKRKIAFITIIMGFFMALLDATIVNISLSKMTEYYNVSMQHISWVMNGYNLAFAVFIITASRLADQFGRKTLFVIGVFAFTLTSFLSGVSTSVEMLIFFRVLQGLSAAIVVPVTVPLVVDLFPPEKQGAIMGVWGAIAGLAAASGPTLGGFLTDKFKWQSIFYVNIPIGIATVILSGLLLKNSFDKTASKRIDWAGVLSLTVGMFAITYALIQANDFGWTSLKILGLLALSAVAFLSFIIIEFKAKEPMLPMSLMKIGPFNGANVTLFTMGAGIMSAVFMLSFFLTTVMRLDVLDAGMTISFMPLSSIVFSAVGGPLSSKLGSRWFAAIGSGLVGISIFLFSGLSASSTRLDVIWRLLITGAGMGLIMAPVMGSAIRNVPKEKVGIVSGVTNMSRALGGVLGIAIMVTVLNASTNHEMKFAKDNAVVIVQNDNVLVQDIKDPMIKNIKAIQVSKESKAPSVEDFISKIDEAEQKALATVSEADKEKVKASYEGQKKEVREVVWPQVMGKVSSSMSKAFSNTFKFGSVMLILGIIGGYFSDVKRRKEDEDEDEDGNINIVAEF